MRNGSGINDLFYLRRIGKLEYHKGKIGKTEICQFHERRSVGDGITEG